MANVHSKTVSRSSKVSSRIFANLMHRILTGQSRCSFNPLGVCKYQSHILNFSLSTHRLIDAVTPSDAGPLTVPAENPCRLEMPSNGQPGRPGLGNVFKYSSISWIRGSVSCFIEGMRVMAGRLCGCSKSSICFSLRFQYSYQPIPWL